MSKERNNEEYQIDKMIETDKSILEDGLLSNEKEINFYKRKIEFLEKQSKMAKYIIKTKNNVSNDIYNLAFDKIDDIRIDIRRRERLASII